MSPILKKEPGTEESSAVSRNVEPQGIKRTATNNNSSGLPSPKRRAKNTNGDPNALEAPETWQYIRSLVSAPLELPNFEDPIKRTLALQRKRALPATWKTRLSKEKPDIGILRLIIVYLNGDIVEEGFMCTKCRGRWVAANRAIDSLAYGKETIYNEFAFPSCVFLPVEPGTLGHHGADIFRQCCNGNYWSSKEPSMPPIWPPSTPVSPITEKRQNPAPTHAKTTDRQSQESEQQVDQTVIEDWEQRDDTLSFAGAPRDIYARSAGYLNNLQGEVTPISIPHLNSTLQVLNLETRRTTQLETEHQALSCIVMKGAAEVVLEEAPLFVVITGGQWTVAIGKGYGVRNPRPGTEAVVYITSFPLA